MECGINIARKIYEDPTYRYICKQDAERTKVCFFISHKNEDSDAAMELGNHIMEDFGYNIYLDLYDKDLQKADEDQDIDKIVSLIQTGLSCASHLIGIITEKSRESWWMPYEIGYAQANKIETSSIKLKNREYLPTYLRANGSPVFTNMKELDSYLSEKGVYGRILPNTATISYSLKTYRYFDS